MNKHNFSNPLKWYDKQLRRVSHIFITKILDLYAEFLNFCFLSLFKYSSFTSDKSYYCLNNIVKLLRDYKQHNLSKTNKDYYTCR
jgi:hypothetical protein